MYNVGSTRKYDSTPELKLLLRELYTTVADKWEDIGIMLDIDEAELATLKKLHPTTPQSSLREMLKIWLKQICPPPSWSAIVEALESLGDKELAHRIGSKYVNDPELSVQLVENTDTEGMSLWLWGLIVICDSQQMEYRCVVEQVLLCLMILPSYLTGKGLD